MLADPGRVIVEHNVCTRCGVHVTRVHHHSFPEIQAEAGSATESVLHLLSHLSLYRESAENAWHRDLIGEALADVAELLNALWKTSELTSAGCRCPGRVVDASESPRSSSRTAETR